MLKLICAKCGSSAKQAKQMRIGVIVCSNDNCECQKGEWREEI